MSRKFDGHTSRFCIEYLRRKDQFAWFIKRFFGAQKTVELWNLAEADKESELYIELNEIWYKLPDNLFNVIVNPKGWSSFLTLLEMYDGDDK